MKSLVSFINEANAKTAEELKFTDNVFQPVKGEYVYAIESKKDEVIRVFEVIDVSNKPSDFTVWLGPRFTVSENGKLKKWNRDSGAHYYRYEDQLKEEANIQWFFIKRTPIWQSTSIVVSNSLPLIQKWAEDNRQKRVEAELEKTRNRLQELEKEQAKFAQEIDN